MKNLSDQELIRKLQELVSKERKTTSEIIESIREVDRRRLYLKLGHTSLFSYLTKGLGYTPASAQRRIDAARLANALPEISNDLKSGTLNLTQVSMLAQSVRQKEKQAQVLVPIEDKREFLQKIKNEDVTNTQKILARSLDLEIKNIEKARVQKDESLRVEVTFTKEEAELFQRVKELISHQLLNPTWSELFVFLARAYIKKHDPLEKRVATSKTEVAPPTKKATISKWKLHLEPRSRPFPKWKLREPPIFH